MRARIIAGFAVLALVAGAIAAEEVAEAKKEEKVDWAKIKCVVSGKAINKEATVDYKDSKVYFCCTNCPKAFKEDTAKFAAKANHQLVATKQFKQEKCPLSGRDLNKEKTVKLADLEVQFCCDNCKGAVTKAEDDEARLTLVFNDENFKKGFAKVKKEEGKEAEASAEK